MKKNKKSFTLIELLVVIGIISVLVAMVVSSMSGTQYEAQKTQAKADMNKIIAEAINKKAIQGEQPADDEELKTYGDKDEIDGLGFNKDFKDPWGEKYPNPEYNESYDRWEMEIDHTDEGEWDGVVDKLEIIYSWNKKYDPNK
jgi:prepilin-type N-terminal cleavage/methylation domain-containing protein